MGLYAQPASKKDPFVPRCRGEISTNDALFQEQAATAVAAAASQSELDMQAYVVPRISDNEARQRTMQDL
jgi:hypothetical protein